MEHSVTVLCQGNFAGWGGRLSSESLVDNPGLLVNEGGSWGMHSICPKLVGSPFSNFMGKIQM